MNQNATKTRGLDVAALQTQLKDSSEQMFRLRFQLSMGQTEGLKKLRELRKERARTLTILRERELGLDRVGKTAEKVKAAKPVAKKVAAKPKTAKVKKSE
jgi:large subunit ribosomal protein L29